MPNAMIATFARFGPAHVTAIALTLFVPLILAAITLLDDSGAIAHIIRFLFAAILVVNKIVGLALWARYEGCTVENLAPMHLCDWAEIAAVITLIFPNQWTYELSYFWSLGGTLLALLTPDLRYGFPHSLFVSFFTQHGGVIAAVLYMTLALGMRPTPMSIVRTLGWSAVYFGAAAVVNSTLGTNFGYLCAKPNQPSLMDYMAPWPFYLIQLGLLTIAFCMAYYFPFFLADQIWSH